MAIGLCVTGFVVFPACFIQEGTRAPRAAPPPPAQGPRIESGGQRLRAAVPADAAERARAALVALGWTPTTSRRADEALGLIHDNVAVIRWSHDSWWARVDQRSEFAPPHSRVPPWDHPWEALRLLHACAPGAGAAEGWSSWPTGAAFDLTLAASTRSDPYTAFPVSVAGPRPPVIEPWRRPIHLEPPALQPQPAPWPIAPPAERAPSPFAPIAPSPTPTP